MRHEKRKRFRQYCRNDLHEAYLIKLKFEQLCEVWKTCSVHYCWNRGVLIDLLIMNKPVDKNQEAGMFC